MTATSQPGEDGRKPFQAEGTAREKGLRWERTWQSTEGEREVLGSERQWAHTMWNLVGDKELEVTGKFSREERINDLNCVPSLCLLDFIPSLSPHSHTDLLAFPQTGPLQARGLVSFATATPSACNTFPPDIHVAYPLLCQSLLK